MPDRFSKNTYRHRCCGTYLSALYHMRFRGIFWLGWLLQCCACVPTRLPPVQFTIYRLDPFIDTGDSLFRELSAVDTLCRSYLSQPIAFSSRAYWQRPDTPILSNFIADALFYNAKSYLGGEVDLVLVNEGPGGRYLPRGNITRKHIYGLIPGPVRWERRELRGDLLLRYLETSFTGKWRGVSAGVGLTYAGKAVADCQVNGKKVDTQSIYRLITIRAAVEEKKQEDVLQNISPLLTGNQLPFLVMNYCFSFTNAGLPLRLSSEKRIHENN